MQEPAHPALMGRKYKYVLLIVIGALAPYFGHAWSHNCAAQFGRVPAEHRASFLICLCFTVLVDQAMYTHFHSQYAPFKALTRYPKFCHGLSQLQHNPRAILATPVDQGVVDAQQILAGLPYGMALFVDEVVEFLRDHMPEVAAAALFDALLTDADIQIPELLVMVDPRLKTDIVVVAYGNLRAAMKRALEQGAS